MKHIKIFTPSIQGFYENAGKLEKIQLYRTTLNTKSGEIVLMTGSILDKSEIDYRNLTNTIGYYYTVIPNTIKFSEIDGYWFKYTKVVYKSEIENILLEKIRRGVK